MTTAVVALLVCVAGGVGAGLRFLLDGLIRARIATSYPVATTVINLTGSLLLGLLTGFASRHLLAPPGYVVLGAGLLGGYTTFSSASFETVQLLESRRYLAAALNGIGTLLAATVAAAVGYLLGAGLA